MRFREFFRTAAVLGAAGIIVAAAAPAFGDSPVADAAMRGDTARVRQLIKQGADVNGAQGDGMTALHWAAMLGNATETQMLVAAGAQLEAVTRNGKYTPLHLAAKEGRAAAVKVLAEAGAKVNAPTTSGGAAPIHFATQNGNVDAVAALLDHGAPVNGLDSALGQTPAMWAAAYDRVAVLKLLITRGADLKAMSKVEDIPARDRADRTALGLRNRRVAAIKAAEAPPAGRGGPAIEAFPAATIASLGFSGLIVDTAAAARAAARAAAPAAAPPGALVANPATGAAAGRGGRAGAPGDTAGGGRGGRGGMTYGDLVGNKGGLTPLLFAVRQGNAEAAMALLAAGADVNQVSGGDHTSPLLMATINGQFDLAAQLLTKGANPKLASDANATPLYATINIQWAAKSLYPQPTAQTKQQTTYLQLAEALLKAGADPNARLSKHLWYMSYNFDLLGVNTTGATPFWRAAYGTDVVGMKLLKMYGADHTIATLKPVGIQFNPDAPADDGSAAGADPSGLAPIPTGGPGVWPLQAATGVGYGEGFAANSHMHAPDSWIASAKYLIEELGVDPNSRDHNGYNALHHAAARGDNELIMYLVSKGVDIKAVSRKGETVADMANGPAQRIVPFPETVALLEKLGSKNSHKCKSC
ncbi:MAG: ankyrin repeat domain-containing protein [Gemmatimonadetes bacterium]|nr:ankyrin repeat domain-containing protein [Gemmatimonadota bacterium]